MGQCAMRGMVLDGALGIALVGTSVADLLLFGAGTGSLQTLLAWVQGIVIGLLVQRICRLP
jgi:hypothetical protein